jgi:hypothetical protein
MSSFRHDCRLLEKYPMLVERFKHKEPLRGLIESVFEEIKQRQRKYLRKRSTMRLVSLFKSSLVSAPVRSQLIYEVINRRL